MPKTQIIGTCHQNILIRKVFSPFLRLFQEKLRGIIGPVRIRQNNIEHDYLFFIRIKNNL
ncbi:hypothetical protein HMPREF0880_02441 [Yokenella regensburgei ATCC 43003]|nr:hypothetical protein HMPREF0880_02441 [Yokenella regensburgei ATCC 43003]